MSKQSYVVCIMINLFCPAYEIGHADQQNWSDIYQNDLTLIGWLIDSTFGIDLYNPMLVLLTRRFPQGDTYWRIEAGLYKQALMISNQSISAMQPKESAWFMRLNPTC